MTQTAQGQGSQPTPNMRPVFTQGVPYGSFGTLIDGQSTTTTTLDMAGTHRDHIDDRLAVLAESIALIQRDTFDIHRRLFGFPVISPDDAPSEDPAGWFAILGTKLDSMVSCCGQVTNMLQTIRRACEQSAEPGARRIHEDR